MVAIVPDPSTQPYHIIAGGIYDKGAIKQLTTKQLREIYLAITGKLEIRRDREADPQRKRFAKFRYPAK